MRLGRRWGGQEPPPTSGAAAEVVECLGQDRVRARADKEGATLAEAPSAQDAVIAELRGNVANIFFFADKDEASRVKATVRDEERTNIEEQILIVFERKATANQEEQIDDCLPEDEEEQEQDQGGGGQDQGGGGQEEQGQ